MHELHGHYLEDLAIGMTAVHAKTITDADIVMFAGVSGDTNPVHTNEEFGAATMFKGRIAHGMLSASLLSTVFGTKLPGPGAIYVAQNIRFKAPVRVGDTVVARCTIREIVTDRCRVVFDCVCTVDGKPVIEGDATLMVSRRADAKPSPVAVVAA